jgi:hypothetical protein
MSIENDINQVETDITNVKKAIRRLELLEKLQSYPEWKELIEEGYFTQEASRVVKLRVDLGMRSAGEIQMGWLEDMLTGIGAFNQYLNFIEQSGRAAKDQLEQHQETHADLLKEQMGGDQ